jgi:hypothetical protein
MHTPPSTPLGLTDPRSLSAWVHVVISFPNQPENLVGFWETGSSTIVLNEAALSDAPPTRNPSMSGCVCVRVCACVGGRERWREGEIERGERKREGRERQREGEGERADAPVRRARSSCQATPTRRTGCAWWMRPRETRRRRGSRGCRRARSVVRACVRV